MNCVLDLLWCWIEKRKRRQQMREVSHCVWLLQWVIFCSKPNSNLNRSNKKNLHLPISCLNNVIEESGGNLNFEFFSEKLCLDMKPSWVMSINWPHEWFWLDSAYSKLYSSFKFPALRFWKVFAPLQMMGWPTHPLEAAMAAAPAFQRTD